ncbi:MAG: cytidine deaminase [Lachnospiraceae bacterium]|nr:cytidine deaminase [Lachnospiraceae bacterium]
MDQKDVIKNLMEAAEGAREKAYVPYSDFSVGAALLTEDGEIFTGCNVENMAYPAGLCAERVALFSAVAAGHRRFAALAVSGGKRGCAPHDYCMPCGMCRQALREFCGPELDIYVVKSRDQVKHLTLGDLLPHAFSSLDKAKF